MWNVFKGTLAVLVRDRGIFVWSLAFPILLSTMFVFMFSNLDEASSFAPVPTAVVVDEAYDEAPLFASTMDTLAEPGDDQILDVREFATKDEALKALEANEVAGVISLDNNGDPALSVTAISGGVGIEQINRTILDTVVNTYVRSADLLASIAKDNPRALADPDAIQRALESGSATVQVSLTHSDPSQAVRYYYALLGMSALFCGQVGLSAICRTQPNLSALGARRAIGATSRGKTLAATLAASWLVSFACLLVAFLYMHVVAGIDFAGREPICIAALAAAALLSTSLGTFLGSLPKLSDKTKSGMLTATTCFLSLFAGLYGQPCMELADEISRNFPLAAAINPAKVVTDVFYSLYYYDSLIPFSQKIGILMIIVAVLFGASTLFIRRQRYASI